MRIDTKCQISRMSGYNSVNRNVSSRVRKVVRDGEDVTYGGRQFNTCWINHQVFYIGFQKHTTTRYIWTVAFLRCFSSVVCIRYVFVYARLEWRGNEFESRRHVWSAGIFLSYPSTLLALRVRFGERFRDGQYSLVNILYSGAWFSKNLKSTIKASQICHLCHNFVIT